MQSLLSFTVLISLGWTLALRNLRYNVGIIIRMRTTGVCHVKRPDCDHNCFNFDHHWLCQRQYPLDQKRRVQPTTQHPHLQRRHQQHPPSRYPKRRNPTDRENVWSALWVMLISCVKKLSQNTPKYFLCLMRQISSLHHETNHVDFISKIKLVY